MSKTVAELAEPAAYACLHEAVADVLRQLGDDEDQVLVVLDAAAVPGWPGHPHMDPLVRWMAQTMPDVGVSLVAGDRLLVWATAGLLADVALVPLPPPVAGALARIAAGEEPQLLLQLEPPADLPGPDLQQVYPDPDPEPPAGAEPAPAEPEPVAVAAIVGYLDGQTRQAVAGVRGDAGGVLVRVAVICGLGAAAAFLLAAGDPWAAAGAVLALVWPVATALLLFLRPRGEYVPRHHVGYRPVHAAGAAR